MPNSKIYSLLDIPGGTRTRVRGFHGGKGIRSKLLALGIIPGTEIYICPECGKCHGCKRVIVRDAPLVIGEGIAGNIECSPPEKITEQHSPCCACPDTNLT